MANTELADNAYTDSRAFNFTLPTALRNEEEIIFLIQQNTPTCNIKTCRDNVIADWARLKRWNRRMMSIRKKAELLVKWKAVILWAHEVNADQNGILICLTLQNWRKTGIKKENPPTPIWPPLMVIKEESVTPQLQYPMSSESSGYTSLDPNSFNWGSNSMVD